MAALPAVSLLSLFSLSGGLIGAVSGQCNTITTYNEATTEVRLSDIVKAARNAEEFFGFGDAAVISSGTGTVSFLNDRSAPAFEPMFCKIEFEGPNEDSTIQLGLGHQMELLICVRNFKICSKNRGFITNSFYSGEKLPVDIIHMLVL